MSKQPKEATEKVEVSEEDKKLANWTMQKFKDAMLAKEPYAARWLEYLNAWNNSKYENSGGPGYKTNHVSNFIFSTIESMRPILFDHNPKFEAVPTSAEGIEYSNQITTILDWEWHRTNMQMLCLSNSVYTFTLGTSVIMLKYELKDGINKSVDGDVTPIKVSPFNLFPDPLATSVEDAEYIIYADYMHVNKLKKQYPEFTKNLQGGDITFSELVNDRDEDTRVDNQVLVLETWCRDYTEVDGDEIEEDGVKKKTTKNKYPRGRVITSAPELGLILEDKENPYETGRFPFFLFKDLDIPFQFWGEGEVKWLLSPQQQTNDLYNQVIDNAKHTANMQWIIDKNAGIPQGQLTNRPGLIVRKNPGSSVERPNPPGMPQYVSQMIDTLKFDIEVISGVHDVTRGETPAGIQSAAAIVALQEAAQIRIRLKSTLHENTLGLMGTEWLSRIKQYWKFDRLVPEKVDESSLLPKMELQGMEMQTSGIMGEEKPLVGAKPSYNMLEVTQEDQLKHDYIVKVIGSSAMQDSRASMLDQMIRLMQTPAEDGMPCVPREAVLDYLPNTNKRLIMQYFQKLKEEQMQMQQQQQMGNEQAEQLQAVMQQMEQLGQVVGQMQQRTQQDEQAMHEESIQAKGYEQGAQEAEAAQIMGSKQGEMPPELIERLAYLDEESLAQVLAENPELEDYL